MFLKIHIVIDFDASAEESVSNFTGWQDHKLPLCSDTKFKKEYSASIISERRWANMEDHWK